ncbi:CYFA0S18e02058g1_1 [Cyberlindnera fabianii]|uniref:CYFA0S18e02058g1_1 n=1 Tax=Cyberlindnera fabianii TaxID=36022 RepID=A0A061B6E6_CYBFA|nr:Mitochondrial distribution and morphology protein 34 [Cyberlindnera fabianii]CDR45470.1 CYFA0S18e02058g1_1 [Cyberlindnera fabianii]
MSFLFSWIDLQSVDIRRSVNEVLSSLSPTQLPQTVSMKQLSLGTSPPQFEVLDIIDLQEGRFKGLFKFQYQGEIDIVLNSDIEINALKLIEFDSFSKPHFVLADKSAVLPVDINLQNVRIDALLTVVYNGKNITVVFNDSPIIDLDIETTMDELLDEDLFETMKTDLLTMATEFLKQDLPGLISQVKLFDQEQQEALKDTLKTENSVLKRARLSMDDEPLVKCEMDFNVFNTMSLKPQGFSDVVQRISLSQEQYQNQDCSQKEIGVKKRRVIKMGKTKKSRTVSSPTETSSLTVTPSSTPLKTQVKTPRHQTALTGACTPVTDLTLSHATMTASSLSSPTLMDTSHSSHASIEEYLMSNETLVFDSSADILELEDPYVDMMHPMDIVPEYTQKDIKHLIPETKMRPRGVSSNYIKVDEQFKEMLKMNNERKTKSDVVIL